MYCYFILWRLVPRKNSCKFCISKTSAIHLSFKVNPETHDIHSDTLFWFRANQFWSFSLIMYTYRRSNKYQFYSLWFESIRSRTHDRQNWKWARLLLPHGCGLRWITMWYHKIVDIKFSAHGVFVE